MKAIRGKVVLKRVRFCNACVGDVQGLTVRYVSQFYRSRGLVARPMNPVPIFRTIMYTNVYKTYGGSCPRLKNDKSNKSHDTHFCRYVMITELTAKRKSADCRAQIGSNVYIYCCNERNDIVFLGQPTHYC